MSKTIAICNQKGGTGKTTTSVNLSALVADLGYRTLLVDMDPQGNATSGVGVLKSELKSSVYNVLLEPENVKKTVIHDICKNLDIIPCNISLTGAEIELVSSFARESRLKKALELVKNQYEFIFIDVPPSLGLLTLNSLVSADNIIIPIQCEFYALEGVSQLINTFNLVKENLNPSLGIEGVLLTMADYRTNLTNEVINEIRSYFKDSVFQTVIPRNIRLSEAPSHGKPIHLYDATSPGSRQYLALAKELLEKNEKSLEDNEDVAEKSEDIKNVQS